MVKSDEAPETEEVKADHETILIECKLIDVPKSGTELRTFNKEFCTNLAQSIKVEGQHNAIVVRPNPEKPGRFILVQGRHRLAAMMKILKEQFIAARIVNLDDESAEWAMISENLWRNPLTQKQMTLSIKKWWDHFQARFPKPADKTAKARAASPSGIAAAAKVDGEEPAAEGSDPSLAPGASTGTEPSSEAVPSANFVKEVAAATGMSERAAGRQHRIAKAFNEEQIEVLDQMSVGVTDRESIAKIKDVEQRGAVVNLIASGKEPAEALTEVVGSTVVTKHVGKEEGVASAKAKEEVRPELSDDDWFDTYCGEKAKLMVDPRKYKIDAIFFRYILEARTAFRTKIKGKAKPIRASKLFGPFFNVVNRVISISHPKDWPICGRCGGRGIDDATKEVCKKCYGSCYELKTEEYT